MTTILPKLRFSVKERLAKNCQRCRDARLKIRYIIILLLDKGRSPEHIAGNLQIHRDTVYRVAKRFREHDEFGLLDRRSGNGANKLKGGFLDALDRLVRGSPQDHGWQRPTWTRRLLVATLIKQGFPTVHAATLSRALKMIRARRGRPRPTVGCPWSPQRKGMRLAKIRKLIENLPKDEVALYEDEVDIHLNPKIGYDWMGYGQQKEVLTPGQNEKRYLAGAVNVKTKELIWIEGDNKDSWLFVQLLGKLYLHYKDAKKIHVILDNYCIHDCKLVAWALLEAGDRLHLVYLPPYCPQHNKIERLWEDLHAEVTRNHTCPTMDDLMICVHVFLLKRLFVYLEEAAMPSQHLAGVS
jgi:transposase